MNFKVERYKKYGLWAIGCWIVGLVLLIGFLLFWLVSESSAQDCYPGFVPTESDPDCDGVITIGIPLAVDAVLGTDGLYYLQCTSGCVEFYLVAPIDVLYAGYDTGLIALETWRKLFYEYNEWEYIPLP